VRQALYSQALKWMDSEIKRRGLSQKAADKALSRNLAPADKLNAALLSTNFDEFRSALKEYVRAGLTAAKEGEAQKEVSA